MDLLTIPQDLLKEVISKEAFFIIPHSEPDGDCIGSALALGDFLLRIGKRVYLHNMGPFDRKDVKQYESRFKGRIDAETVAREPNAAAIVVDCSTIDRIGELSQDIRALPVIVIDHHSSGIEFGNIRFINPSSPSTSLLIQQLIEALGYQISAHEADLIMFGFCTDTGFFRHLEAKTGHVFEFVSRLVDAGASPKAMYARMNSGAAFVGRHHLGVLLSRAQEFAGGKIIVTWEYMEETKSVGKANRESDLLYQLLLAIENVEVVAVLREESKTSVTGGLRSKSQVDVGKLAMGLGGGGHARAAGFMVPKTLDEVKALVLPLLESEFV